MESIGILGTVLIPNLTGGVWEGHDCSLGTDAAQYLRVGIDDIEV